ncbi:hypothetical protein BDZ97DRAFT_1764802 [Flammula alnicola]|nr:hypothetical protein BDZ97DRAFT_1764802 [Flammula alnicola]
MNKGFTSGVWPSDDKSHPQPQITPLHGLNDEELASTTKLPRDQAPTPSSDDDVQAAEAHNASAVVDEDSKCSEETPEPEAEAIHEEDVEVPSSPAMHTIFSWPPRRPQPKRLQRMSAAIKWPSSTMINRISKRALVVPPYTDLDSASTSTTTTTTRNRASASTIGSASTVGDASTSSKHRDIIFAIVAPNLIRQALTQPLAVDFRKLSFEDACNSPPKRTSSLNRHPEESWYDEDGDEEEEATAESGVFVDKEEDKTVGARSRRAALSHTTASHPCPAAQVSHPELGGMVERFPRAASHSGIYVHRITPTAAKYLVKQSQYNLYCLIFISKELYIVQAGFFDSKPEAFWIALEIAKRLHRNHRNDRSKWDTYNAFLSKIGAIGLRFECGHILAMFSDCSGIP